LPINQLPQLNIIILGGGIMNSEGVFPITIILGPEESLSLKGVVKLSYIDFPIYITAIKSIVMKADHTIVLARGRKHSTKNGEDISEIFGRILR
jgi:hypothetical protein